MRVGIGYDIHRLEEGRPLILGGVKIPSQKGSVGHSDGDPLLHAITDAILGAASLGDIGQHFPDTDPRYKDKESHFFLKEALRLIKEEGYEIENIDSNVILQSPKLSEFILAIRRRIASFLGVELSQVSVKAKSNEKLDALGNGEGVAAQATVLLTQKSI